MHLCVPVMKINTPCAIPTISPPTPSCSQIYFANIIDIKVIMKQCGSLHGGLNKLAETLDVERIGPQHQVGGGGGGKGGGGGSSGGEQVA